MVQSKSFCGGSVRLLFNVFDILLLVVVFIVEEEGGKALSISKEMTAGRLFSQKSPLGPEGNGPAPSKER